MKAVRFVGFLLLWTTAGFGQIEERKNGLDRIWQFAEWYRNDSNPVIEGVSFTGRFQHDFAVVDAGGGGHHESNIRRMRAGVKARMFRSVTVHGEVELNPQEADPVYTRITDLYIQWDARNGVRLTAGKHGAPFTLDGATSSKELLAIDRSNLTNNLWFPQEYFPGISVSGESSSWNYHVGVYSAGRANREFGEFNGSVFTLAVIGYDLASALGVKEAVFSGNYVYQNPEVDNTFTRRLQHIASANVKLEADRWGLRADVSAASGYLGQSDLWGVMAMPFFNATPKLQLVGRYTHVESRDANGVQPAIYESRVAPGRGDRYREVYLGVNYYVYGHKLKLQTGIQAADMNDRADDGGAYSGLAWTSGVRVAW